jgi:hypothetical protein
MSLKGYWNPNPFWSLSLSSRSPVSRAPTMMYCAATGVCMCWGWRGDGPGDHELKSLKLWAKINLSFSKLFILGIFWNSNGKLTHPVIYLLPTTSSTTEEPRVHSSGTGKVEEPKQDLWRQWVDHSPSPLLAVDGGREKLERSKFSFLSPWAH